MWSQNRDDCSPDRLLLQVATATYLNYGGVYISGYGFAVVGNTLTNIAPNPRSLMVSSPVVVLTLP
jgi:hypothetical protein